MINEKEILANIELNVFVEYNIPKDLGKVIIRYHEKCNEAVSNRNSILNDLYYKDGIRDGVKFIIEII